MWVLWQRQPVWVWGGITSKGSRRRGANDGFGEGAVSVGFGEKQPAGNFGRAVLAEYEATHSFVHLKNSMQFHGTNLPWPA